LARLQCHPPRYGFFRLAVLPGRAGECSGHNWVRPVYGWFH